MRLSGDMQQIPRDKLIRNLIGVPEGWNMLEIDGSQIELRVASMVANERTMLSIYANNGDIHAETAKAITGKSEVNDDERKMAKSVNFGQYETMVDRIQNSCYN